MNYFVDKNGYFGEFGGAFIPEMLQANITQLEESYVRIINETSFQEQFQSLLKDYVGRPSPLYFAPNMSAKYGAKIYLKREDLNHTGSHKINNTVGQALLASRLGKKRIIAETGAGQHGVATATVCALLNFPCVVYMGEKDIQRQSPNVARMKFLGAEVRSVTSGSKTLKDATNEAMRDWISNPEDTHYIIGSVVGPHPFPDLVARFQSVISAETRIQLKEKEGRENPDYCVACVGGGSNSMGMFYHFIDQPEVRLIAVEAAGEGVETERSAATIRLGTPGVLHGSKTILMQSSDGQVLEAHSISAGLDYPGIGPQHAHLSATKRVEYLYATDEQSLIAAKECAELEGIIPALETAHAFVVLPQLGLKPTDIVVISLSGRGDKDMETYMERSPYIPL